MSKDQLINFLEFVQNDSSLQEQLTQATDATAFAAIAANAGFGDVSPEIVTNFFEVLKTQQNTLHQEDELSAVSGGVGGYPAQSKMKTLMAGMAIDMITEMAKETYSGAVNKGYQAIDAVAEKTKSKLING